MPPSQRRTRLKVATTPLHKRLDSQIAQSGAFKSLDGYREYLSLTFNARKSMEDLLDRSQAQNLFPCWPQRRIADILRLDLADLGVKPPLSPVSSRGSLDKGGVLGALYVLEGSAIGARWIKRLVEPLGAGPSHGGRHLISQISMPGAFNNFLDILEKAELTAQQEEECLAAALYTFERFERSYAGLACSCDG